MSATVSQTPLQQEEQTAIVLAQAAAQQVMNAPPGSEPPWAKPAVALGALIVFVSMLIVAFITKNSEMQTLLGGAAVSMATTAVSYYLGSSSGSDKKTEMLAAAPAIQPSK